MVFYLCNSVIDLLSTLPRSKSFFENHSDRVEKVDNYNSANSFPVPEAVGTSLGHGTRFGGTTVLIFR